jgi:citrate synthase
VRHGAASYRAEALLEEVGSPERATAVLQDRLRRGEPIPGFGHNLYPDGDPRASFLIGLCRELLPGHPAFAVPDAVIDAAAELIDERPNVDFGLVVLSRALGLARGSALTLMALGRMAGWVAHALEQYEHDQLIRPRARYVGPEPIDGD